TANETTPVPVSVVGPWPIWTHGPLPTRPTSPQAGGPGSRKPPNPVLVVPWAGFPSAPGQYESPNGQTPPPAVTVRTCPGCSTRPVVRPGTASPPTLQGAE